MPGYVRHVRAVLGEAEADEWIPEAAIVDGATEPEKVRRGLERLVRDGLVLHDPSRGYRDAHLPVTRREARWRRDR